jgi:hypothetical protein
MLYYGTCCRFWQQGVEQSHRIFALLLLLLYLNTKETLNLYERVMCPVHCHPGTEHSPRRSPLALSVLA